MRTKRIQLFINCPLEKVPNWSVQHFEWIILQYENEYLYFESNKDLFFKEPLDNNPLWNQAMNWRRPGDKPLTHLTWTTWPPFRRRMLLNENEWISLKISLRFVPKVPTNNIQALVQLMASRRSGDKPLFGPMMVSLLTHICVPLPQWVIT